MKKRLILLVFVLLLGIGSFFASYIIPTPTVSVVMPVYNRANLVGRAIESVLNQTYSDFELIVVDDGSMDNTLNVVKYYQKKDSRIRIVKNPQNCGVGCARNNGNDQARGKYIVPMDSDDIMLPELLQTEVAYLEQHPETVMVYGQREVFQDDDKIHKLRAYPRMDVLRTNTFWNVGDMFRRDFVVRHNIRYPDLMASEDYDFWAQILINGGQIDMIDDCLVRIRHHQTNGPEYYRRMVTDTQTVSKKVMRFFGVPDNIQSDICHVAQFMRTANQTYFSAEEVAAYEKFACMELEGNPPDISIIISTYNYDRFLSEAIESVLNNGYDRFELIIVDDGSTDDTASILKTYQKKDRRIKIITEKNHGLSYARNQALKVAKGRYVWFLDSDDKLVAGAIAKIIDKAEKNHADLVTFYTQYITETGDHLPRDTWNIFPKSFDNKPQPFTVKDLSDQEIHMFPGVSGKNVYRRHFLLDYQIDFPEFVYFEDDIFFLNTLFAGARVSAMREVLYDKRMHGSQITQNRPKYFSSTVKLPMIIFGRFHRIGVDPARLRNFVAYYTTWAVLNYQQYAPEIKRQNYMHLRDLKAWVDAHANGSFLEKEKKMIDETLERNLYLIES